MIKKILILLILVSTLTLASNKHKYKEPEFQEFKKYKTCNEEIHLPLSLKLGKSNEKDLVYIEKYGRIFLEKNDNMFKGVNNNFDIKVNDDGTLDLNVNVLMIDVNYVSEKEAPQKGTFYHSYGGYLHSHIYPDLEKNIIKIDKIEYKVAKKDEKGNYLYKEENSKFTVFMIPKMKYGNKEDKIPDLAEFKFKAKLCEVK